MLIAASIVALVVLALVGVLATARQRATTGRLSRETRQADASVTAASSSVAVLESDDDARARAGEARRQAESGLPVPRRGSGVVRYEPVDPEELGVTRRQFFNRGILIAMGLGVGGFGAAALAFLWPATAGGFGGKVVVGNVDDIQKSFQAKQPFYNAAAKTYIQPYPTADVGKASKIYSSLILAGMKLGYVALYQKCVHLGCRVPWCQTSQWFECPCHGSKYNRVGEKRGGPAPRGLDRFPLTVSGGAIVVDTGTIVQGPPIGTDTTGQGQEGALCV